MNRSFFPAAVLVAFVCFPACRGTADTPAGEKPAGEKAPDARTAAALLADELALVVADLDVLAPLFKDNADATRIIASARAVCATLAATAKAGGSELEQAIAVAREALQLLAADPALEPDSAQRIRAAIVVAQLILNHAAPPASAPKAP